MESKEQPGGIPELKTSPEIQKEVAAMEQKVKAGPEEEQREKQELMAEATAAVNELKEDLEISETTSVKKAEDKVEEALNRGVLTRLGQKAKYILRPILIALSLGLITPAFGQKKELPDDKGQKPQPIKIGERPDYRLDVEKRQVEVGRVEALGERTKQQKENIALLNQEVLGNNGELPPGVQKEINKAAAAFAGLLEKQQKTEGASLSTTDFDIEVYQPLQEALGIGKIPYSVEEWAKQSKILSKMARVEGGFTADIIKGKISDLIVQSIVDNFLSEDAKQRFTANRRATRQEAAPEASELSYDIDKISREIISDRGLEYLPGEQFADVNLQRAEQSLPGTLRLIGLSPEQARQALTPELLKQFVEINRRANEAAKANESGEYDHEAAKKVFKKELPELLSAVEGQAGVDQSGAFTTR